MCLSLCQNRPTGLVCSRFQLSWFWQSNIEIGVSEGPISRKRVCGLEPFQNVVQHEVDEWKQDGCKYGEDVDRKVDEGHMDETKRRPLKQ